MIERGYQASGEEVHIRIDNIQLEGELNVPENATGIVLFAHGSGSGRFSPRNNYVAEVLRDGPLGTLLFDLLTREEEQIDMRTRHLRFDIGLLASRLLGAMEWLLDRREAVGRRVGFFGASTGAGAALLAAAARPNTVGAVVSRGGRPDLAGDALPRVKAPTLLIVGGHDDPVIEMNQQAMARMHAPVRLEIVPGATHLFEEPGTLETAARLARDFFSEHLGRREETDADR